MLKEEARERLAQLLADGSPSRCWTCVGSASIPRRETGSKLLGSGTDSRRSVHFCNFYEHHWFSPPLDDGQGISIWSVVAAYSRRGRRSEAYEATPFQLSAHRSRSNPPDAYTQTGRSVAEIV